MSTGQMFGSSKVPRVYKIVILGDGGVGKTALTQQFVYHRFPDRHDPTIEEIYRQQAVIDNEAAQIDILDTAGQPEFTAMREQYMREGEGFIICYSISDHRTLEEVRTYKRLIDRVRNRDDIPIVLAGNKCDLDEKRQVDKLEGQTLAKHYSCPFYETSARKRLCVEEVFHELVRQIRLSEQQNNPVIRKQSRRTKLIKRMRNFFTGMSGSRR